MQTKLLWEFKILPTSKQTQGGKSKEGAYKEGSEPTGNCAGFAGKDRSTMEDGMPKCTTAEQLQKMQDKADAISKLQRELQKDIQAYKLSRLQYDDASSDVSNTGTKNEAPNTLAVPDQTVKR